MNMAPRRSVNAMARMVSRARLGNGRADVARHGLHGQASSMLLAQRIGRGSVRARRSWERECRGMWRFSKRAGRRGLFWARTFVEDTVLPQLAASLQCCPFCTTCREMKGRTPFSSSCRRHPYMCLSPIPALYCRSQEVGISFKRLGQ